MKKQNINTSIAVNKKATFNYFLEENFEAGLVLQGWEIKSIRAGKIQVTDAYVLIRRGEAYIVGTNITPLNTVSTHVHPEVDRTRKLLLHKKELDRLIGLSERKGYTIVLVKLYWKEHRVKCQIALGKGKQEHDKRATMKDRDWDREKARVMRRA